MLTTALLLAVIGVGVFILGHVSGSVFAHMAQQAAAKITATTGLAVTPGLLSTVESLPQTVSVDDSAAIADLSALVKKAEAAAEAAFAHLTATKAAVATVVAAKPAGSTLADVKAGTAIPALP